jgi:DNA-binding PucR family transcriptional regulator
MEPDGLLSRLSSSGDLAPFREVVEPLVRYDRERGSDLVRTLRVYFACGSNASEAADKLFLHRNSMLYRLARIEKLTGADLKNPRVGLILQLGLLAVEGEGRRKPDAVEHP